MRVWRCRSADVKVWRCRSAGVKVWRCRSADVKVWRSRSAGVKVWRSRSAGMRVWRCRSADVKVWRSRSADVKVWRCSITAAFLRRTLRRRSREKHMVNSSIWSYVLSSFFMLGCPVWDAPAVLVKLKTAWRNRADLQVTFMDLPSAKLYNVLRTGHHH